MLLGWVGSVSKRAFVLRRVQRKGEGKGQADYVRPNVLL